MNHPPSSSSSSHLSLALLLVITVFTSGIVLASSGRHYAAHADNNADDGGDHELLMMERFHAWMAAHGRSYPTTEEKLQRFHIYRENVEFIEATNRDSSKTYTCGENQFTDLTHQEFLARYTMAGHYSVPLLNNLSSSVITTRAGDMTESDFVTTMQVEEVEAALPEEVDWRKENAVTPVQNQKQGCNACWVFASVATIESAHEIKKGELLKLSEKEIVDCESHCRRGYAEDIFSWVKKHGIATESKYGCYHPHEDHCNADVVPPAVWVKDYSFVPQNSEQKLAAKVAKQPVAVRFDATDRGFACYKHGIYTWGQPCNENGVCSSGQPVGAYDLNHAMAIIGYGKNVTTGQKFWIAKNSWGTGWGDYGYAYIQKDVPNNPQGVGGLAIHPRYPIV